MSERDEALTRLAFEAGYRAARPYEVTAAEIDQAWRRYVLPVFARPEPVKTRHLFRLWKTRVAVHQGSALDAIDLSDRFDFREPGEAA